MEEVVGEILLELETLDDLQNFIESLEFVLKGLS